MTWSAEQYTTFEDERTRPVRDLLSAVPGRDVRRAIDFGCGPGTSTEFLVERFPDAEISGLDSSADMIAAARKRLPKVRFDLAVIETWNGPGPFDAILANAVFSGSPITRRGSRASSRTSPRMEHSPCRCPTISTNRRTG